MRARPSRSRNRAGRESGPGRQQLSPEVRTKPRAAAQQDGDPKRAGRRQPGPGHPRPTAPNPNSQLHRAPVHRLASHWPSYECGVSLGLREERPCPSLGLVQA